MGAVLLTSLALTAVIDSAAMVNEGFIDPIWMWLPGIVDTVLCVFAVASWRAIDRRWATPRRASTARSSLRWAAVAGALMLTWLALSAVVDTVSSVNAGTIAEPSWIWFPLIIDALLCVFAASSWSAIARRWWGSTPASERATDKSQTPDGSRRTFPTCGPDADPD